MVENNRKKIIQELTENLFDIKRWPHYQLMFDHLDSIIEKIQDDGKFAILERCYIYGGLSIFSSLFDIKNLDIFDFVPPKSLEENRKNYQKNKLDLLPLSKAKMREAEKVVTINNLMDSLKQKDLYDCIFVPNVLHHYPNPFDLFKICNKALKEKGCLYIFDATLRENHQKPDDFLRFTPDGITYGLESNRFKIKEIFTSNSPLEALLYTTDQVIQYDLPSELLAEIKKMNNLIKGKYSSELKINFKNKVRNNTSFPIAYSVLAEKIRV